MKGKLFLVGLVTFFGLFIGYISAQAECKVVGEVRDREGAIIPRIPVTFSNSKVIKIVKADNQGTYEVKLPTGFYKIATQLGESWNAFERAKVNISCSTKLVINIYSFPKVVEFDNLIEKYHCASLPVLFENDKIVPVIVFRRKEFVARSTIYFNAIFTYDRYTLSASKIILDIENGTIVGSGAAWLENGEIRKESNEIRIEFNKKKIGAFFSHMEP